MTVGLPKSPRRPGTAAAGAACPRLPFDAVDEGGFLAADERAGAHLDDDVEAEAAVEDVASQQAVGPGAGDGRLQPSHRQRVLGADVDVGLGGADGVGRDDHAFEQPVRVAFA